MTEDSYARDTDLGSGLHLIVFGTVDGAYAELTRMPQHPGETDILLMRWEGSTPFVVERRAARWLREMARLADGLPIVTSVSLETVPAGEGDDANVNLRVLVSLEHDDHDQTRDPRAPRDRIVQEHLIPPIHMMISHGSNAYYFGNRESVTLREFDARRRDGAVDRSRRRRRR